MNTAKIYLTIVIEESHKREPLLGMSDAESSIVEAITKTGVHLTPLSRNHHHMVELEFEVPGLQMDDALSSSEIVQVLMELAKQDAIVSFGFAPERNDYWDVEWDNESN